MHINHLFVSPSIDPSVVNFGHSSCFCMDQLVLTAVVSHTSMTVGIPKRCWAQVVKYISIGRLCPSYLTEN